MKKYPHTLYLLWYKRGNDSVFIGAIRGRELTRGPKDRIIKGIVTAVQESIPVDLRSIEWNGSVLHEKSDEFYMPGKKGMIELILLPCKYI